MPMFALLRNLLPLLLLSASCAHDSEKIAASENEREEPAQDVTGEIAFVNVNVVPMEDERVLERQTVLVREGKIVALGPAAEIEIPARVFRIDGTGKYLMPGLADMHTHIYYQEDLLPYVANGVTTVLNMGSPPSILQFRQQVAAGEILGPAIFAGAFVDGVGNRGWIVRTAEEARADVRQIKAQGWDFIKAYNGISTEVFNALMEEAKRQQLAVIGHGVRAPGMKGILEAGQAMIAHAEEYLYTHFRNSYDASLIPSAAEMTLHAGAYLTPTLSAYETILMQWGNRAGRDALLAKPEIKFVHPNWKSEWSNSNRYLTNAGSLVAPFEFQKRFVKDFHDAGVPLLLGTDTPFIPGLVPGFGIHHDLRTLVASGLRPYDALKAGTQNAGEFIRRHVPNAEAFGTITVGKRADMILLTANPLSSIENVAKRSGVMVRGRWLSEKKLQEMMDELARAFGG